MVLRMAGASESYDSGLQRRRIGSGDESFQVGNRESSEEIWTAECKADGQITAALLGTAAIYGRADVHGGHHHLPVHIGPASV